jgi:hypothetical protein
MNIKLLAYQLILVFILFVSTISLSHGQAENDILNQDECNFEPKVDETIMWYNESQHKIQNPDIIKLRVGGIAIYNQELYMVNKRLRVADIYKFDFDEKKWILPTDSTVFKALDFLCREKALASGLGGIEIVGDTLFTIGISKTPFCAINLLTKEIVYAPEFELPNYKGGEDVEGISFSFPIVYLAFHSLDYDRPIEDTQRFIGFDVSSGKIVFNKQLNLSENRRDAIHGLAITNKTIWHIRDNYLVKMNGKSGEIIEKFMIEDIKRPTSLCFFNNSLWIITYYGGLYEVPVICN